MTTDIDFLTLGTPGGLTISRATRKVSLSGKVLELTATEFDLLWVLVKNEARVVTYEEITSLLWGSSEFGEKRALEVQISRLRGKLGETGAHPHLIHTIRDVGYRFTCKSDRTLLASLMWDGDLRLVKADFHDAALMDSDPKAHIGTYFTAPCDQWVGYSHDDLTVQVRTMFDQGIRFLGGPCSWQPAHGRSIPMEHFTTLLEEAGYLSGMATDFYSPPPPSIDLHMGSERPSHSKEISRSRLDKVLLTQPHSPSAPRRSPVASQLD